MESLTWVFGAWMALAVASAAIATWLGSGSLGGFGNAYVCGTLPNTINATGSAPVRTGISARRGASIEAWGTLHACAVHPTIAQRIWYTMTDLPSFIFWACLLFLLWRMLSAARSRGPFAPQVATALRRLGWFIVTGAAVAAALHGLALDMVLNSLFRPGPGYGDVFGAMRALVPVPAIAGATMLTFARVIQAGQAMDEEIKATV